MDPPSYGSSLAQTLVCLAAVSALAWWLIRVGAPRLRPSGARMRLEERLPLAPGHALYLVRVDDQTLVVGATERGLSLITHCPPRPAPSAPLTAAPLTAAPLTAATSPDSARGASA